MPLKFKNTINSTVWLAVAYWDQSCTGNKWRKEGWWTITPGNTVTVWTGAAKNRDFLFFARDLVENNYWGGDYYTDLPLGSLEFSKGLDYYFSRCWDEPIREPNRINRGMRIFTATADDYTYNLLY